MKLNRIFWIVLALAAAGAAAFFWFNGRTQAADGTTYQTEVARRGTLTASVGATGTVRAGQSAVLTWQTSGRVESVNVVIGQQVAQDEVLASLAQTSLSQGIILAEADLVNAQKNLDDLLNSTLAQAKAEQNLANALQALDDAQKNMNKISFDRASDDLIEKTEAELDLAKLQVSRAEDAYKLMQNRPDGDSLKAQALLNLSNARLQRDNLIAKLNWYKGSYSELDAQKYRAALAVAEAQVADARREIERLKDGPNPEDIAAAKARVAAAQATLNQAKILAPFDGVVTAVEPQPGDMVTAGKTAFRVDDLSRLLVDVQISEVDINSVEVGQPVALAFDAVQGKTYNGEITKINGVGDSTSGAVNFTVTVALTDADDLVKPGMTAAVTIRVKEVKDALLVPNRAVRVVDGQRVVYILKDGVLTPVTVRLGASSDSMSEVVGGDLQEGDTIVLNPPSNTFGPGSGGGPRGGMFGG
ncbi:MAG: efflux RND transporter periplasmic adaptor subunit [Anaerolineales bacterium]